MSSSVVARRICLNSSTPDNAGAVVVVAAPAVVLIQHPPFGDLRVRVAVLLREWSSGADQDGAAKEAAGR